MAWLYADENFPFPVVTALRALGHDVVTMAEDGQANLRITDDAVLARATELDRVLLTANRRHFMALHGVTPAHAGIIVCTFDHDFAGQADRIHKAIAQRDGLASALLRITRPNP